MSGYGLKQVGKPRNYTVKVDTAKLVNQFYSTTPLDRETTTTTSKSLLETAVANFESESSSQSVGTSVTAEGGVSIPVKGASIEAKRSGSLTAEKKEEAVKSHESSSNFGQEHEWGEVVTVTRNIPAGVYRLSMHTATYTCGVTSYTDGIGEEELFSIAVKVGVEAEETWDLPNPKGKLPLSDYKRFRGAFLRLSDGHDRNADMIRDFEAKAKVEGWIQGFA